MDKIKFISDSSCDLSFDIIEKYGIEIAPFRVTLDGENYVCDMFEITKSDFYRAMRENEFFPKTSLPPVADYYERFKKYVDEGYAVICVNLSSKFSGSYQSAFNAMELLKEENPNANVYVVDSKLATIVQGLLILEMVKMRDAGMSASEIAAIASKIHEKSLVYITVDTLKYLQKGGRVGKANALAGTIFNIKPLITLGDGELLPLSKVRGRKKALSEIVTLTSDLLEGKNQDDYIISTIHSDAPDEAAAFEKMLHDAGIKTSYPITELGVTIGAHIGPTVMGIACLCKYTAISIDLS